MSKLIDIETRLFDRIVAAIGAIVLVIGVGMLLSMKSEPMAVQVQDEQAVFVSLIDEPIAADMPKGEQVENLPVSASIPKNDELLVGASELDSVSNLSQTIIEKRSSPKHIPKKKVKYSEEKIRWPDKNMVTKAFGVPDGKEGAPAGGNVHLGPVQVTSVNYLVRPRPITPRLSIMRGERGVVIVRVVISTTGIVKRAFIEKASPYSALNNEALRAVKIARFRPYTENEIPRESIADIPVEFE